MWRCQETTEILIGGGGWAYFRVPGLDALEAYARAFDFVEVNSTFYDIPTPQLVGSWRRRVTPDFEFSVRCHQDVTHKHRLEPVKEAFDTFEVMMDICGILNSRFLVFVTPSTMDFSDEKIESVRNFLDSIHLKGVRIAWEVRRGKNQPLPSNLVTLMRDYDIIHSVDLSREDPGITTETLYSRLFGKGEHNLYQFTDEELLEIDDKITTGKFKTAILSFHGARMYKDAARYQSYKQTSRFPTVTKAKGLNSLREVLMEDARFPVTKQELVKRQGWKVIDLTEDRRVHVHELLKKLPDKRFRDIEEVLNSFPRS